MYLFRIDLQVLFILLWQFIVLSSMWDWTLTFSLSYKHLMYPGFETTLYEMK